MTDLGWLPPLLSCDWNRYEETLERAYEIFRNDFGESATRPSFRGRRLGLKHHPEFDGKSATFWHFVTEGKIEANRDPDGRRLERIGWPRALILEADRLPCRIRVWSNLRGQELRWLLALADFSYLVVLADRGDYLLPWTAYPVDHDHQRRKLQREHDASLARTAKIAGPDRESPPKG